MWEGPQRPDNSDSRGIKAARTLEASLNIFPEAASNFESFREPALRKLHVKVIIDQAREMNGENDE
jgi:hypothetical protein